MNRRVVCPFCYSRMMISRLWFQCEGHGTGRTDGCRPTADTERERLTGFTHTLLPAFPPSREPLQWFAKSALCPWCYGKTTTRACPACHMPLPHEFGRGESPFIAMVGATGTGKTIYLTVLADELRQGIPDRFEADVRLNDGRGGIIASWRWVESNIEQIYRQRILLPRTAPAAEQRRESLVFSWRSKEHSFGRRSHPTTFLSFSDTAGDDLGTQQSVTSLRYMRAADALIVLLDPFTLPGARERLNLPPEAVADAPPALDVLNRVTQNLNPRGKKIKIPVAVVFAKMDALFDDPDVAQVRAQAPTTAAWFDEQAGQLIHESVKALLHTWNGSGIHRHLEGHYANYRYFFVSALGAQPDYKTGTLLQPVTPYRVDEPLVWLLSQFDVIDVKDGPR